MFMLIFMWTPPHFWALALFMKEDYHAAGVPMLTVTHGRKSTRTHILVYTILLIPFAVGAAFTSIGGPIYLAVALAQQERQLVRDLHVLRGLKVLFDRVSHEGVYPMFLVGMPMRSGLTVRS